MQLLLDGYTAPQVVDRLGISSVNVLYRWKQEQLENRRGEIDKLRGFFESVGEAADSAAKLKQGSAAEKEVIESPPESSVVDRHLPTLGKVLRHFRQR